MQFGAGMDRHLHKVHSHSDNWVPSSSPICCVSSVKLIPTIHEACHFQTADWKERPKKAGGGARQWENAKYLLKKISNSYHMALLLG